MKKIFSSLDKESARRISGLLLEAADNLNKSANLVRQACTEEEFISYRNELSYLISDIGDVMEGIYFLHPDIRPYSLEP